MNKLVAFLYDLGTGLPSSQVPGDMLRFHAVARAFFTGGHEQVRGLDNSRRNRSGLPYGVDFAAGELSNYL